MELLPNNSTKSKTSPALAGDVLLHIATRYDVIFGRIMLIVGDIKNHFCKKRIIKLAVFIFNLCRFLLYTSLLSLSMRGKIVNCLQLDCLLSVTICMF